MILYFCLFKRKFTFAFSVWGFSLSELRFDGLKVSYAVPIIKLPYHTFNHMLVILGPYKQDLNALTLHMLHAYFIHMYMCTKTLHPVLFTNKTVRIKTASLLKKTNKKHMYNMQ